jgi:AcrR family transcriptional regulator
MTIAPTTRKPDRRVQRTRELLSEALMALILEKGYDGLTVQDIADRANVSRATFYLHYKDKDDLLFSSMQERYDELTLEMGPHMLGEAISGPELFYDARDFEHVAAHADFYRVMFSERGAWSFISRVQDYLASFFEKELFPLFAPPGHRSLVPPRALAHYHAAAQIGLIRWWLEAGMPYTPQEMGKLAYHLYATGGWQSLGLKDFPELPWPEFKPLS